MSSNQKVKSRRKNVSKEEELKNESTKANHGKTSSSAKINDAGEKKDSFIKIDYKRIVIRCIVIVSLIVLVNIMHKDEMQILASQKDFIEKKEFIVSCSKNYSSEIKVYPGCVPKNCGRYVSDSIVEPMEAVALLSIAQRGLMLGGSLGGASILDLHSGALSKGSAFTNIYKLDANHKVITKDDLKLYRKVKNKIKSAIAKQFGLVPKSLHLTHPTFFSRIDSTPAQTIHDEYWHPHVDKETYPSFHYTSLLYLSDYNVNFKGGRFVFMDKDSNKTVEPRQGRLSAFTSGSENLHFVEKVSEGVRFAITVSFTCDQKHAIKDPDFNN